MAEQLIFYVVLDVVDTPLTHNLRIMNLKVDYYSIASVRVCGYL